MSPAARIYLLCCVLASGSAFTRGDSEVDVTVSTELVRRPVIDAAKLADMRGGLSVAGLDYTIGAVMRTRVDGSVVLESAIDLGKLADAGVAGSFEIQDAKGFTRITQDLNKNQMVATVVNEANLREIQVQLDINVTLQNYQSVQAAYVRERIMNSLSGIIGR